MIPIKLKRQIERTAKMMAPYESGNMRHNAIYGNKWSDPNKFQIVYDLAQANYIAPQQDGWNGHKSPNQGFIDRTVAKICNDVLMYFGDNKMPRNMRLPKSQLLTNDLRELRNQKSLQTWQLMKRAKQREILGTEQSNQYLKV